MAISYVSATSGVSALLIPHGRLELPKEAPLLQHYDIEARCGRVSICSSQKPLIKRLGKLSISFNRKPQLTHMTGARSALLVCSAALNARCGAEGQTQTMEKPTSVIQNAPGKEKSPQLDDGGTGLPPRDDGGGGGGGGGGNFSGGFFFFGFLAFLGFLKDKESEGDYRDSR